MQPLPVLIEDGGGAKEILCVSVLSENTFKLLLSPGMVLGMAKDDVFKVVDGKPCLLQRGSNVCVQIFKEIDAENTHQYIVANIQANLNATLDGENGHELVFTIPITEGFSKIRRIFDTIVGKCPGYGWSYGNVYDLDGVTPLNWWTENQN